MQHEHYTQINNYKHRGVRNFEATSVEFYADELHTSLLKGKLRPMIIMMVKMTGLYIQDL